MQNDTLLYVQNILSKNGIKTGYKLEDLCAHVKFLKEKSRFVKENKQVPRFEPIFSLSQTQFLKREYQKGDAQ